MIKLLSIFLLLTSCVFAQETKLIPHMVMGNGWKTFLRLSNNTDFPMYMDVDSYMTDSYLFMRFPREKNDKTIFFIPPNSSYEFEYDAENISVGTLFLRSNEKLPSINLVYKSTDWTTSVEVKDAVSKFSLFVDNTNTGFVIGNKSDEFVFVLLQYFQHNNLLSSEIVSIAPRSSFISYSKHSNAVLKIREMNGNFVINGFAFNLRNDSLVSEPQN